MRVPTPLCTWHFEQCFLNTSCPFFAGPLKSLFEKRLSNRFSASSAPPWPSGAPKIKHVCARFLIGHRQFALQTAKEFQRNSPWPIPSSVFFNPLLGQVRKFGDCDAALARDRIK